ncbi:MAG: NfeD family protein, partial [Raineya sp.]
PGKLIVFTTSEAIKNGYCEGKANSIEEILAKYGMQKAEIIRYVPSTLEKIISFFLNPAVSSLLVLLIIGGIYFELQTPGVGFPLIAAIVGLALYFIPYYVRGLAENWELLLFFGGMALLAVELFLLPGSKIFAIAGLLVMFGALGLMMLGNQGLSFEGVPQKALYNALIVTSVGLFGGATLIALIAPKIATSKKFSHVALQTTLDSKDGYVAAQITTMIGKEGKSYTVLRPSGKIIIDGELYDAFTQGDFIEKDQKVVVIGQEGAELIVRANS